MGEAAETAGRALLPILGMVADFANTTLAPIVETAAASFGDLVAAFQTGAEGGFGFIERTIVSSPWMRPWMCCSSPAISEHERDRPSDITMAA
jgi:hypothetical protein